MKNVSLCNDVFVRLATQMAGWLSVCGKNFNSTILSVTMNMINVKLFTTHWPLPIHTTFSDLDWAGSLLHQAVSRDSDSPFFFWSCNQHKVYFWPTKPAFLKSNTFSTIAGRYYTLHTIQLSNQPNNAFCIRYYIVLLRILFNPEIKEQYVSVWCNQNIMNLM